MLRKSLVVFIFLVFALSLAATPNTSLSAPTLSAAQIVDRNVAARGGLETWRSVQAISMEGKLGAGGNQRATLSTPMPGKKGTSLQQIVPPRPTEEIQLPFVMDLKRPGKMRFELQFRGETAVQIYDGSNGWKLRPYLGRREVEPFTADELMIASTQAELDGPLVDYARKGTQIEFVGMEKVEDRDAYKLKLKLKNGTEMHVWIDALTFLEAKVEGQPRRLDGTIHPVEVYYWDYRQVNGLLIPFLLETRVVPLAKSALGAKDIAYPPEKITIEKVVVNPKLDEALFSKPNVATPASAPAKTLASTK